MPTLNRCAQFVGPSSLRSSSLSPCHRVAMLLPKWMCCDTRGQRPDSAGQRPRDLRVLRSASRGRSRVDRRCCVQRPLERWPTRRFDVPSHQWRIRVHPGAAQLRWPAAGAVRPRRCRDRTVLQKFVAGREIVPGTDLQASHAHGTNVIVNASVRLLDWPHGPPTSLYQTWKLHV